MKKRSLNYTFEALVNSLLREFPDSEHIKYVSTEKKIIFTDKKDHQLHLGLNFHSVLGKHQYNEEECSLGEDKISLEKALDWIIDFSCQLLDQSNQREITAFKDRVSSSNENIKKFTTHLGERIEERYQSSLNFIDTESLLILGHSFHPYPKARDGFSEEDFQKYSPEFQRGFSLAWAISDDEIIFEKHMQGFDSHWIKHVAISCLGEERVNNILDEGKSLLPIHPYQLKYIREEEYIKSLEEKGKISFIQEDSTTLWYSTSSVRSIYSPTCKYMLKFSLTLRLTNSIRHLQQVEVDRGIQVSKVLNTKEGKELKAKWKDFQIIEEPAYAAFKDQSSKVAINSIVSCRINPFINGEQDSAILLATLNQLSPSKTSILDQFIERDDEEGYLNWFKAFTQKVITPLLDAQANFGIFLGAHQQNIILKLDDAGLPVKMYFRDCQGTGYSEEGFKAYSPYCDEMALDNGNILTEELGQKIFCYYLIINTTFDTISHLSLISGLDESKYLQILNKSLRILKEKGVKDSSCIDYLLNGPYLWVKGNYKCCLKEINENTMKSPTDIYIPMKNRIQENI
ncbi:putative siderophore biosynthesis protein [Halobacteriovorax marinus SJ]|uniref:Siderophore biosynthesis protein n=1 Tax=Halobacteriovorax marinus (strain ATCC BAA-682 / DSM 15412 / SJ) TaxID=862908 RepID=E1X4L0_HALMS|nr:IucA/IucC family protein [Halobacteriovorax marinus]CBW25440.1 putative siderophore biosynthesis protein [Halobacteriovorax marinus SJ]